MVNNIQTVASVKTITKIQMALAVLALAISANIALAVVPVATTTGAGVHRCVEQRVATCRETPDGIYVRPLERTPSALGGGEIFYRNSCEIPRGGSRKTLIFYSCILDSGKYYYRTCAGARCSSVCYDSNRGIYLSDTTRRLKIGGSVTLDGVTINDTCADEFKAMPTNCSFDGTRIVTSTVGIDCGSHACLRGACQPGFPEIYDRCRDKDGGANLYVASEREFCPFGAGGCVSFQDRCGSGSSVQETYCWHGNVMYASAESEYEDGGAYFLFGSNYSPPLNNFRRFIYWRRHAASIL